MVLTSPALPISWLGSCTDTRPVADLAGRSALLGSTQSQSTNFSISSHVEQEKKQPLIGQNCVPGPKADGEDASDIIEPSLAEVGRVPAAVLVHGP